MFTYYRLQLILLAIVVLIFGGILAAYQRFSGPEALKIIVILKATDERFEFWQVVADGINEAAKEFDTEVIIRGPKSEKDVQKQVQLVEEAIIEKPDAIILAAIDYDQLAPVAEQADAAGIKMFVLDSGINSTVPQTTVATDNFKAGTEIGRLMSKYVQYRGKIAVISYVKNASSQIDRARGVREVLSKENNITLLDTYYVEGVSENTYTLTKAILRTHPDLKGIIGLNEPTSVGAGKAIRELGLKNQVKLVGFDSSINEIQLVEEGIMQATVIQRPFQMGYVSIKTAINVLRGKRSQQKIDTGFVVITKNNMYEEENQKLLFPF